MTEKGSAMGPVGQQPEDKTTFPPRVAHEEEVMAVTPSPRTRTSLAADMRRLGLGTGAHVVVHASMSSLGWVCGGEVDVILALMDVVGPEGTIVMPAFTAQFSDPAMWEYPPAPLTWHDTIRAEMPLFDPRYTPSLGMGKIAECFRCWPATVRSAHPQSSFAAWGKHAQHLVEDHRLSYPFDVKTSPVGKLSALPGSQVLLLGVSWNRNSSFHVADQLSGCFAATREGCPWLDAEGNKIWQEFESCAMASEELLEEVGKAFEDDKEGCIRIGKVGSATCRLFSCADCINFAADYYRKKGIYIES